jgi:uncharacterized protein YkwD
MRRFAGLLAALVALGQGGAPVAPSAGAPPALAAVPPALVSSSRVEENTIVIALVNPRRLAGLDGETRTLSADLNSERAKRGVPALTRDAGLDRIAYAKAVDMAVHGYFGHTDPSGVTFQDRMRAARWPTTYVAENIAFDRDEPHAHEAFVNSPGHYANMIDPNLRRLGVAVVTAGNDETFYVQVFSGG